MIRLSRLTLVFAVLFAIFIVSPAFFNKQFAPYPLIKVGDVIDLFTPLVLIPVYWLLFQIDEARKPTTREAVLFLALAALWVEGQGIHLVANAIGHLTHDIVGSDVESLTHFFDEVLSHYLWHIGLVGLSALLLYRQWRTPFSDERSGLGFEITAGLMHGLNYFVTIVEAATAPLGVPFALAVVVFALVRGRGQLRQQPLLAFFFVAYATAVVLFLIWGIYWGGLPEFSKVGIIE